jgi:hypothetical protein
VGGGGEEVQREAPSASVLLVRLRQIRLWLRCFLIMDGLFAKRLTEEPNHGTLAYFIIRYRYIYILAEYPCVAMGNISKN